MSTTFPTKTIELGDKTFAVQLFSFRKARAVYSRLQQYLVTWGDDELRKAGGPMMFVGLGGLIKEDDLDFFAREFGACTTVTWYEDGEERVVPLTVAADGKSPGQDAVFVDNFHLFFAWLDFAVEANFKEVIEKMLAARELMTERARKIQEAAVAKSTLPQK